jgi:hypothetical protein
MVDHKLPQHALQNTTSRELPWKISEKRTFGVNCTFGTLSAPYRRRPGW